jgi:hypothetical protein
MLRVFAHSDYHFGHSARRELLAYIKICEDTIEQQAAMLRADITDLTSHQRENTRLKAEIITLRQLTDAALIALRAAPCCDLHNAHCEPPSDLCCNQCTEAAHPYHHPAYPCVLGRLEGP